MNIKIEGWKVTIHNENGDRLELNGEFEADFFKEYESKQLIIANVSQQRKLLIDCVNFCDGLDLIENSTVEEQVDSYLSSINCG